MCMSAMALDFDLEQWQRIENAHQSWWAGTLRRPLIHLTMKGRDPGRAAPSLPAHEFASYYDANIPPEAIADRWLYDLECRTFLGDSFPQVFPNFGAGVIAAFLGAELQNGEDTVWFHAAPVETLSELRFRFDPENFWFRRICDIYRAAADRFEGRVHLGMTDLGGNLDIVASLYSSERLLMDLYDAPDVVRQKCREAHEAWWQYYQELNRIIQGAHPGYTCWTPLYSQTPYYMLQCDFAFMIGPDMFDAFVKPELEATCRKLSNPFYHLDGPGQLAHLDSLLAIPELKGIQWVPGAGQSPITQWPEVFRKIRRAGKRIQFFTSQDPLGWRSLPILADQLGSAEGIMMYGEIPPQEEREVRKMLERFGAHSI